MAAAITAAPTVTIQVEPGKRQGSNGFVLTGDTTALTATGYPSGGTYAWQAGPKLLLAGSGAAPNTAVQGAQESSSAGDTWVQVSYTAGGQTAMASVRFTVRETRSLATSERGNWAMTTRLYDSSGRLVAYMTPITYFVRDQFLQDIELRIPVIEVLHTEYVSHPVDFDPPDGVPKTGYSETSAQFFDILSVNATDGVPLQFSATRHQELNMRGRLLWPQQIHRFHCDWAEVIYTVLSW